MYSTREKFELLRGKSDSLILGIETSCDETAAAVVLGNKILSGVVASQIDIHQRFGGVVPEIASRNHLLEIMPVIDGALKKAGVSLEEIDAIAVTFMPGLIGSLLVGVSAAKSLSFAKNIPLIGVNHIEAHIAACWVSGGSYINTNECCHPAAMWSNNDSALICQPERSARCESQGSPSVQAAGESSASLRFAQDDNGRSWTPAPTDNRRSWTPAPTDNGRSWTAPVNAAVRAFNKHHHHDDCTPNTNNQPPFLACVASGGHTSIYDVRGYNDFVKLDGTLDDAIGEAFDKVGRVLGLPYPGGPNIDKLSKQGTANIKFTKNTGKNNISYSGLKTAVINYVNTKRQKGEELNIADICASFNKEAADMLVQNILQAAKKKDYDTIVLAGGVAANSYLRAELIDKAKGLRVVIPGLDLCGDNAVMVAIRGFYSAFEGVGLCGLELNARSVI